MSVLSLSVQVQCSVFSAQCPVFNVQCSVFCVQCSVFSVLFCVCVVFCSVVFCCFVLCSVVLCCVDLRGFRWKDPLKGNKELLRSNKKTKGNIHFIFLHRKHFLYFLHFPPLGGEGKGFLRISLDFLRFLEIS